MKNITSSLLLTFMSFFYFKRAAGSWPGTSSGTSSETSPETSPGMTSGMVPGMMSPMASGTSSRMGYGALSGMMLSTKSEIMTSAMTFGTKPGMTHGWFPGAAKPKLFVEIKMGGITLEGPLQQLPIIHYEDSILKKQKEDFQHYSVYIEMKNGIQYKSESLTRIIVIDDKRHIKSTATIHLGNTIHTATNFVSYNVENPQVKKTPTYRAASGIIYVALQKTKYVFRAMVL